jgi:hypothetical protein
MNDVRHRSHPADRSGALPGGPAAEPPFGSPPYGIPPSGAPAGFGRSPYPYGPAPSVRPQHTARFGSPYPGTAPYPVPYPARTSGAPPRWGGGLPTAVIAGITALVLAGVVTLVVLIAHARPGAAPAPATPGPRAGERQVITTQVDDDTYALDTDTRARGDAVLATSPVPPCIQVAH